MERRYKLDYTCKFIDVDLEKIWCTPVYDKNTGIELGHITSISTDINGDEYPARYVILNFFDHIKDILEPVKVPTLEEEDKPRYGYKIGPDDIYINADENNRKIFPKGKYNKDNKTLYDIECFYLI